MIPDFPKFKKLEIEDKKEIELITKKYTPYSDYNFTSLWSYNVADDVQISNLYGNFVIKFRDYITSEPFYSFLGNNQVVKTINTLLDQARQDNIGLSLKLIPEINLLGEATLEEFLIEEDRDNFDYILSTEEVVKLNGKKYENKRNKVTRFLKDYPNAEVVIIDLKNPETHSQIYEIFSTWEKNKNKSKEETEHELIAIKRLLSQSKHLQVICLGVYIKGNLVGFSITEILHNEFAIFHFVKADPTHTGIFEFIYTSTAKELHKRGSKYLNREQDLGITGLRDAKQSWRPIHFLKKHTISRKEAIL